MNEVHLPSLHAVARFSCLISTAGVRSAEGNGETRVDAITEGTISDPFVRNDFLTSLRGERWRRVVFLTETEQKHHHYLKGIQPPKHKLRRWKVAKIEINFLSLAGYFFDKVLKQAARHTQYRQLLSLRFLAVTFFKKRNFYSCSSAHFF